MPENQGPGGRIWDRGENVDVLAIHELFAHRQHLELCAVAEFMGGLQSVLDDRAQVRPCRTPAAALKRIGELYDDYRTAQKAAQHWVRESPLTE